MFAHMISERQGIATEKWLYPCTAPDLLPVLDIACVENAPANPSATTAIGIAKLKSFAFIIKRIKVMAYSFLQVFSLPLPLFGQIAVDYCIHLFNFACRPDSWYAFVMALPSL